MKKSLPKFAWGVTESPPGQWHAVPCLDEFPMAPHLLSRYCPCGPELELYLNEEGEEKWAVFHRMIQ